MKDAQVYLDCAAAMPPDAGVLTYYSAMLKEFYVNQEAIHLLAYRGRQALADAGRRVSKVLTGAENHPVIWGSSATELFRLLADAPFFRSAVSSVLEHPAVAANLGRLPEFTQWHADKNGAIVPQKLAKIPDLALFHQVQSELGVIQNLDALFELLPGACRAVDAVQAAGKLEIYPGADRTSLMVVTPHKPGALYRMLSRFNALGINLLKLESRPIPDRDFEFMFYFDLEASVYSEKLAQLLSELEHECDEFSYLGSYSEVI